MPAQYLDPCLACALDESQGQLWWRVVVSTSGGCQPTKRALIKRNRTLIRFSQRPQAAGVQQVNARGMHACRPAPAGLQLEPSAGWSTGRCRCHCRAEKDATYAGPARALGAKQARPACHTCGRVAKQNTCRSPHHRAPKRRCTGTGHRSRRAQVAGREWSAGNCV